jgi:hypothetical protein
MVKKIISGIIRALKLSEIAAARGLPLVQYQFVELEKLAAAATA